MFTQSWMIVHSWRTALVVCIVAAKIVSRFVSFQLSLVTNRESAAMDISADLQELTKCPVGLVSAGVKSILDIRRYEKQLFSPIWH